MIAEILLGLVTPIGSLAKERAAYNGVDRTIEFSREHFTYAPIVLLRAEEAVQEDDGSIAGFRVLFAGFGFVEIISKLYL